MSTQPDHINDPDNPLAWVLQAACLPDDGSPPVPLDGLFVEAGHAISEDTYATCVSCPVRLECLKYAYDEDITFGYFGGISPSVRKRVPYAELVRLIGTGRIGRGGRLRPAA